METDKDVLSHLDGLLEWMELQDQKQEKSMSLVGCQLSVTPP